MTESSTNREQIATIAEQLGLSRSTVYFALAGTGTVSEQTRARVREAAQQLGYQPNRNARVLRTRRTCTIGIILRVVLMGLYDHIIRTMATTAADAGYRSLFTYSFDSAAEERKLLQYFTEMQVEGIIIMTSSADNSAAYQRVLKSTPCVFVESPSLIGQFDSVYVDHFAIGYEAARHLIAHGRDRLAYLHPTAEHGHDDWWWSRERLRGFRYATQELLGTLPVELGLQAPAIPVMDFDYPYAATISSIPHGLYAWQVVKNEIATIRQLNGIFVANDEMAFGTIQGLSVCGFTVPSDIAVIGCDDKMEDVFCSPPLTSIRQPMAELGTEAMKMLLNRIQHTSKKSIPQSLALKPELMVRASCGEPTSVANV